MSALVTLLNQSVDYAGLFPPAALDLETVASNYADYRHGAQRWMLSPPGDPGHPLERACRACGGSCRPG